MSLRTCYVQTVRSFSKAFLYLGCKKVTVKGLDKFLDLLTDLEARNVPFENQIGNGNGNGNGENQNGKGIEGNAKPPRGVLTYANHISVLDEPTLWGCLPWNALSREETTRWTLGASDIMFTDSILSHFFRVGQVIETERGRGIFQPAIDEAISKLENGRWVHLFPEGYVNLSRSAELRRFKWGVGRMLQELKPENRPFVVPMWISGFDKMMPEPRGWPRFLPRFGAEVSITFGDPINHVLDPYIDALKKEEDDGGRRTPETSSSDSTTTFSTATRNAPPSLSNSSLIHPTEPRLPRRPRVFHDAPGSGWPQLDSSSRGALALSQDNPSKQRTRSRIVSMLRIELANLGLKVRFENGDKDGLGELVHSEVKEEEEASEEEIRKKNP